MGESNDFIRKFRILRSLHKKLLKIVVFVESMISFKLVPARIILIERDLKWDILQIIRLCPVIFVS